MEQQNEQQENRKQERGPYPAIQAYAAPEEGEHSLNTNHFTEQSGHSNETLMSQSPHNENLTGISAELLRAYELLKSENLLNIIMEAGEQGLIENFHNLETQEQRRDNTSTQAVYPENLGYETNQGNVMKDFVSYSEQSQNVFPSGEVLGGEESRSPQGQENLVETQDTIYPEENRYQNPLPYPPDQVAEHNHSLYANHDIRENHGGFVDMSQNRAEAYPNISTEYPNPTEYGSAMTPVEGQYTDFMHNPVEEYYHQQQEISSTCEQGGGYQNQGRYQNTEEHASQISPLESQNYETHGSHSQMAQGNYVENTGNMGEHFPMEMATQPEGQGEVSYPERRYQSEQLQKPMDSDLQEGREKFGDSANRVAATVPARQSGYGLDIGNEDDYTKIYTPSHSNRVENAIEQGEHSGQTSEHSGQLAEHSGQTSEYSGHLGEYSGQLGDNSGQLAEHFGSQGDHSGHCGNPSSQSNQWVADSSSQVEHSGDGVENSGQWMETSPRSVENSYYHEPCVNQTSDSGQNYTKNTEEYHSGTGRGGTNPHYQEKPVSEQPYPHERAEQFTEGQSQQTPVRAVNPVAFSSHNSEFQEETLNRRVENRQVLEEKPPQNYNISKPMGDHNVRAFLKQEETPVTVAQEAKPMQIDPNADILLKKIIEIMLSNGRITQAALDCFFQGVVGVRVDHGINTFFIATDDGSNLDSIQNNFSGKIADMLNDLGFERFSVKVLDKNQLTMPQYQIITEDGMHSFRSYTFDNYVVGESNRVAHGYAKMIAAKEIAGDENPFFLYGDSGCGKTHLSCAIGNHTKLLFPHKKIKYCTGSEYMDTWVSAIQNNTKDEFKRSYRGVDVLIMDDIQLVVTGQSSINELFDTFDNFLRYKKQIIFTSDRSPDELKNAGFPDRITTRFQNGLVRKVESPDFELRRAIIRTKAQNQGLTLGENIEILIANRFSKDVRNLEGAVKSILAYKDFIYQEYSKFGEPDKKAEEEAQTAAVMNFVAELMQNDEVSVTPERIIEEVARYFNFTPEQLKDQGRKADLVTARNVSIFLMHSMLNLTLKEIGNILGGRDHSTIVNSLSKINKQRGDQNPQIIKAIEYIEHSINTPRQ